MNYSLGEWAKATGGEILAGDPDIFVGGDGPGGLSIDSRKTRTGEWFIALSGVTGRDGHEFIEKAIEKGASGLIISDKNAFDKISATGIPVLLVKDTTVAMGDAARGMLTKYGPFVIAITGTVGKTTVKENVAHIASTKWKVLKNELNWNTEIGVPLTVFNLEPGHEVVVLECATRGIGQISYLSKIAQPHVAVITAIGAGHLSEFGDVHVVTRAKWEIHDGLKLTGTTIAPRDSSYTGRYAGEYPVTIFGLDESCDYYATGVNTGTETTRCRMVTPSGEFEATIPGTSHADLINAVCTTACVMQINPERYPSSGDRYAPLSFEQIGEALRTLPRIQGRMESVIHDSGIEVIFDAYNSNPLSLKNALDLLAAKETLQDGSTPGRRVAVLGDMLELGDDEIKYHLEAGERIGELGIDCLITVGKLAWNIRDAAEKFRNEDIPGQHFETTEECGRHIGEWLQKGDLVLVKASRSLEFEKLLEVEWKA